MVIMLIIVMNKVVQMAIIIMMTILIRVFNHKKLSILIQEINIILIINVGIVEIEDILGIIAPDVKVSSIPIITVGTVDSKDIQ